MSTPEIKFEPRSITFKPFPEFEITEELIAASHEIEDRVRDLLDEQIAQALGIPAPWPSRMVRREMLKQISAEEADFLIAFLNENRASLPFVFVPHDRRYTSRD